MRVVNQLLKALNARQEHFPARYGESEERHIKRHNPIVRVVSPAQ